MKKIIGVVCPMGNVKVCMRSLEAKLKFILGNGKIY